MIPFKPKDLRMAISKLLEILGDQNGIVYSDKVPMLKIRRYDVTQANSNVVISQNDTLYDVTQRRYVPPKPSDVVVIRGKPVVIPELDSDGQVIPNYGF